MSTEFTIGENKYRVNKLPPRAQAHLMRRLMPIVSSLAGLAKLGPATASALNLGPAEDAVNESSEAATEMPPDALAEILTPIATAISDLPDPVFDYIWDVCLSSCQIEQGGAWMAIYNVNAKRMQFDWLDLQACLQIIVQSIAENLSGFFPAGRSSLQGLLKTAPK